MFNFIKLSFQKRVHSKQRTGWIYQKIFIQGDFYSSKVFSEMWAAWRTVASECANAILILLLQWFLQTTNKVIAEKVYVHSAKGYLFHLERIQTPFSKWMFCSARLTPQYFSLNWTWIQINAIIFTFKIENIFRSSRLCWSHETQYFTVVGYINVYTMTYFLHMTACNYLRNILQKFINLIMI